MADKVRYSGPTGIRKRNVTVCSPGVRQTPRMMKLQRNSSAGLPSTVTLQ